MAAVSRDRTSRSILNGRMLTCPRCKKENDVLRFIPMEQIQEFASETVPPYKCPECRWIFALADRVVNVVNQRTEE